MIYKFTYLFLLFLGVQPLIAQDSLENLLKNHNEESVPYIKVSDLATIDIPVVLLDAREKNEYEISHLPNAIFVGYNDFDLKYTLELLKNKTQTIVVYCSLGVRSEDVATQLKDQGYGRVFNLYGGIFEWINQNQIVYNSQRQVTNKVHAYSEYWSKWLKRGIKVYE